MAGRQREPAAEPGESFEELFSRLEEVARRLEAGNLGLEESITLYEDSAALVERLRAILDAAEVRVQDVRARLDGRSAPGAGA